MGSGGDERASLRRVLAVHARVRVLGVWYDVQLLDLSSSGYRYTSHYRFAEGQRALLKLDSFEAMGGDVVWHIEDSGGVRFDRPLHLSVVETIAQRHPGLVD